MVRQGCAVPGARSIMILERCGGAWRLVIPVAARSADSFAIDRNHAVGGMAVPGFTKATKQHDIRCRDDVTALVMQRQSHRERSQSAKQDWLIVTDVCDIGESFGARQRG